MGLLLLCLPLRLACLSMYWDVHERQGWHVPVGHPTVWRYRCSFESLGGLFAHSKEVTQHLDWRSVYRSDLLWCPLRLELLRWATPASILRCLSAYQRAWLEGTLLDPWASSSGAICGASFWANWLGSGKDLFRLRSVSWPALSWFYMLCRVSATSIAAVLVWRCSSVVVRRCFIAGLVVA